MYVCKKFFLCRTLYLNNWTIHSMLSLYICVSQLLLTHINNNVNDVVVEQQLSGWIEKYQWKNDSSGLVYITNQEDLVKTKKITEKISFDSKLPFFYGCLEIQCPYTLLHWCKSCSSQGCISLHHPRVSRSCLCPTKRSTQ